MSDTALPAISSANGTLFFVESPSGLRQGYDLIIANPGAAFEDSIRVIWEDNEFVTDPVSVACGETTARIYIPDIRVKTELTFLFGERRSRPFTIVHTPRRHWVVHLIQFAHHDLGYTDLPSNVLREYCGFYDDVLQFCRETDDFPDDSKFRYTIEQGWSLLHYLDHRPPEVVGEIIRRIKEGRIEVNALLGNMITELLGPEEMVRLLYPVFELKRKYGIPVVCAEHNDIPGISWGLAAALAGVGIRWFAPALPDYFRWHDMNFHTFWDEDKIAPGGVPSVFYWEAPAGERVLFWYGRQGAGGDVDVRLRRLVDYLEELEKRGYPYDVLRYLVMGGFRDNAPPRVEFALTCREWNSKWAYPRFVQSLNARFFVDLEKRLGPDIPTYWGELPGTDYPVGACSTVHPASLNRVTHDQLLIAEKVACVASSVCDYQYPTEALKEAYYCTLLGDEHTWGLAHPVGPGQDACVAQISEYSYRAAALTHDVFSKAINELADRISRNDDGIYVVVFNALNWKRSDVVVVPAKAAEPCGRPMRPVPGRADEDSRFAVLGSYVVCRRGLVEIPNALLKSGVEVVDVASGQRVPHEVYEITNDSAVPYAAQRYSLSRFHSEEGLELRFVARDVPACGWKLYKLEPSSQLFQCNELNPDSDEGVVVLENDFYRVEVDLSCGGVRSIVDKELGRELVDTSSGRFLNQMVVRSSLTGEVTTSGPASVQLHVKGSVAERLVTITSASGCPKLVQEIALYKDIKRIDISNRLLKDSTPMLETYFAFPFAFDQPRFRYEGSLCQVEVFADQMPGSNTDYYAVQHWAEVSDQNCAVALTSLDAPVMQFGDNWPLYVSQAHHGVMPPGFDHAFHGPEQVTAGHIYSLVLLNNFRTNFSPAQCGDFLFRYSFTSGASVKTSEFGYGVALPLSSTVVQGRFEDGLPIAASFCQIEPDDVILLALKRAEDGNGLIVRLLETGGEDRRLSVAFPTFSPKEAYETNMVEENICELDVSGNTIYADIKAYGVVTLRVLA
jgi:hypothetical protein